MSEPVATAAVVQPRRLRRLLKRVFRIPTTKVGVILFAGMAAGIVGGVMWFVPFSESAAFCTGCHTMEPEAKAYHAGAHADVACGECHVAPGLAGWVKAKIGGLNELRALVTFSYPTPIPAPEHGDMPPPSVTCMKCHQLDEINKAGNPVKLILKTQYKDDEANTAQLVAVAIRPPALSTRNADATVTTAKDVIQAVNGVHWHVATEIDYYAADPEAKEIPLVQYKDENGHIVSWVKASEIGLPANANIDIKRLKRTANFNKAMDCVDCHNRVGHDIEDAGTAVDKAIDAGAISRLLPYIKRDAVKLVYMNVDTREAADAAIDAWAKSYAREFKINAEPKKTLLDNAAEEIKKIYHETATPHMKANSVAYTDNLGHQQGVGCFRCHDGSHVKVVDGVQQNEYIPSTCSTCHTFPQVGGVTTSLQLGVPPTDHRDRLYVFNHKTRVASVTAAFTGTASCQTCHEKTYCENCHNSGAINVDHDVMIYNHAMSLRVAGRPACAYCHQKAYCSTCHGEDVLGKVAKNGA